MNRWQWAVRLLTRRMWFRASLFCLFAVLLGLGSALLGHAISYEFAASIGAKSVDHILDVLASSMLAVTTFSLTAMVQAYSGATSNITPRAVQLLVDDRMAQNALATFLGSFLFAIVGIIALSTGVYGETGRVLLFIGTILVIGLIVVTFLRWIDHVTHFGRVGDTIERVEKAATRAVQGIAQRPAFGAGEREDVPDGATTLCHPRIGRVTHVDLSQLQEAAEAMDAQFHLMALPGATVDPARPILWTNAPLDEEQRGRICAAFTVDRGRAFDHDPRFGLVVLAEIASRALSPAVNDPGTAMATMEAGTRVLATVLRHEPDEAVAPPERVTVPPLRFRELLDDLFRPISRDGAGIVEVGIRLQGAIGALAAIDPEARAACRAAAQAAFERMSRALDDPQDQHLLASAHARFWPGG
ncbi:DUF2254 domain-containing protein [Sphingomonas sp. RS6]